VTSSEWPDAAAIERERRQRAALAFMLMLQGGSGASKMPCESSISSAGSGTAITATKLSPGTVQSIPPSRQHQPLQLLRANTDRRRVRIQYDEPQSATTLFPPGAGEHSVKFSLSR